jgi:5'(3')-deoxyribonucleotidase
MNKTHFLLLLFSLLLFSCTKKSDNLPRKATGKINTISVIIDDQLWNGEIGDSIRNKFASPVIGLPQEEPLFTINQYPAKLMEGFINDSRTIIVVKKDEKNQFSLKKNQYASPQNVFHISGKTNTEILEIIEKNAPKIIQIIKETEITENQRIIEQSLLNTQRITKEFNISLKIPSGYLYVLQEDKIIWLKKEIISGNTNILIYQVPISSIKKESNGIANIIKMRDSIGGLYIQGTEPEAKMITEEGYAPYLFKINLDGKETFETKGTWELKNDFMSGPFINYAIVDEQHDRILVLEGFCYSPSKEERDLMHELESIIKSIRILK